MVKIKLVDDQIDRIIIDELKNDYHVITREIDPSQRLLAAIKCVLRYFMNTQEYGRWETNSSEPEEHDGPFVS